MTRVLHDWGVPGTAIAIVKDDAVVWSKGYGVRWAGGADAVTPETIFAIGSLSKLDTAQYIRMLLGPGVAGGLRLLSPQSMRALHAPTTIIPEGDLFRTFYPDAHSVSYGLGFIIHDYHDVTVVEHGGQTDGMPSTLVLVPEFSLGVIVLTNAPLYGSAIAIGYGVIDAYLGRPPRDWSAQLRGKPDAADSGFRRLARVPNAFERDGSARVRALRFDAIGELRRRRNR